MVKIKIVSQHGPPFHLRQEDCASSAERSQPPFALCRNREKKPCDTVEDLAFHSQMLECLFDNLLTKPDLLPTFLSVYKKCLCIDSNLEILPLFSFN